VNKKSIHTIIFDLLVLAGLILIISITFRLIPNNSSPLIDQPAAKSGYPPPSPIEGIAYPPPIYGLTPTPQATLKINTITPTITPTPQIDANGWYIYSDKQMGYSFSYPRDSILIANGLYANLWLHIPGVYSPFGIEIEARLNPNDQSATMIGKQIYESTSLKSSPSDYAAFLKAQSIMVGGKPAIRMKIPSIGSDYTVIVPHGRYSIIINIEHDAAIVDSPPAVLKLVDDILATVAFFEPEIK
jgi:hypothetical protein